MRLDTATLRRGGKYRDNNECETTRVGRVYLQKSKDWTQTLFPAEKMQNYDSQCISSILHLSICISTYLYILYNHVSTRPFLKNINENCYLSLDKYLGHALIFLKMHVFVLLSLFPIKFVAIVITIGDAFEHKHTSLH